MEDMWFEGRKDANHKTKSLVNEVNTSLILTAHILQPSGVAEAHMRERLREASGCR